MAVIDIPRFVSSNEQVALRISYDRLPGLVHKRLEVPQEAVALVRKADKTARLLKGGESEGDFVDGVLVKKTPITITFALSSLASEDALDVAVELALTVA